MAADEDVDGDEGNKGDGDGSHEEPEESGE